MSQQESDYYAFWKDCQDILAQKLLAVQNEEIHLLKAASLSVDLCAQMLHELQTFIRRHSFPGKRLETYYYKEIRPYFFGQYYFHHRSYQLELNRPAGDYEAQRPYFEQELTRIQEYRGEHRFIHEYIRRQATYLDDRLFFHTPDQSTDPHPTDYADAGPGACSYDKVAARLQAGQRLQAHIAEILNALRHPGRVGIGPAPRVTWTESKTGLIELAYALQSAGVFNNGKVDLKEIVDYLQEVFHINLGNYPRTFQEILSRKTGYTNFLDRLRDKLLLRIQTIEEKYDR